MSVNTPTTNIYSNGPIKGLEYIQNKALVIAPFEITKSGKLDPDLLLDTPGIININLYKKMVSGEDKEPTAEQFKTIKYISEIDSSNQISSFDIPVIFKYDKETNTRIIEKVLKNLPLDYMDLPIDILNTDFSQLTGSDGFYCICCVQKNTKTGSTAFTEVSNEDFLFMIPSIECRELNIDSEFDILDINNKAINLKKCDPDIDILFNNQKIDISKMVDFFDDKTNVATYLFNDNLNDENGLYNATGSASSGYSYETGIFGKAIRIYTPTTTVSAPLPSDTIGISMWFNIRSWVYSVVSNLFSANKNNEIFRILPSIPDGCIYITNKTAGTKLYKINIQLTIDTWYHIYMDNNKSGIYLNGVFYPVASEASFSFSNISTLNTFRLSTLINFAGTNDNHINGSVEQLRLFNRVLTETEIKSLYLNSPTSIILNSSADISKLELTASVSVEDQTQFTVKDYETNNILTSSVTLPAQVAVEPDFFNDKTNVATYLFNDNLNDENGLYNAIAPASPGYIYETGKFGKAIFSNNKDTSINLGNPHKGSNILSVSFWLKWSGINKVIPISLDGQCLYFFHNYVGISTYLEDMTGFSSNGLSSVWKHFVIEFNSGKVGKIWLDGVKQELNSIYGSFKAYRATVSNLSVYIGLPSYGAFGSIDQVRLFNRSLTPGEIVNLQKETKKIIYNIDIPTPTKKLKIETSQGANYIAAKTWIPQDPNIPWYRIYPIINIPEVSSSPKYYLGSKYQRNIMEVLAPALKSKRTISNLKDMYLVDDLCINTLEKINILLENDQMIKFTERLYNLGTPLTPLREKLNADLILEYISIPVSESQNNDLATALKTSLIEDYNFTQEEIDNLNDNLNAFKSRARIALATPTIDNDKFRFNLPKTFIDGNRSKTEKKNLLVFGTNAGFNKFGLSGYSEPYSNISKRVPMERLQLDDLTTGLTTLSSLEDTSTIKDFQMSYGDSTHHILFENGNLYACRYVDLSQSYQYNRDGQGFTKQSFPLKLINTNVKSMACLMFATFIIDNNNDVWALGGYSVSGTSTANPNYDFYGINSSGNYLPNWTKVFNCTPENTPKKVVGTDNATWLLMESGELFCTGDIRKYYTFDGIQKYTKTWISLASGVLDVDCGDYHVCYTLTNGEVYVGDYYGNERGLTTQSTTSSMDNTKVLKIKTDWIPINQTIVQIECTIENNYYLLSNGDVYGVGMSRAGQLGYMSSYGVATPKKLYTGVKRIIPQLFGRNNVCSVSMVELITGEIKCLGNTSDYKFGYYVDYNTGVTTPITLYPKVDKIFLTERNVLAIIDGKIFNSGWNRFSGINITNQTITEQFFDIVMSKNFEDILSNYKQQIPFTYIPLSTDIDDVGSKPVFENLTDITGFNRSDIVIDIPNVL